MKLIHALFAFLLTGSAAMAIPGPIFIPLGKSVQVTAVASPQGAFFWNVTDSSIATLQSTLSATVTVTGNSPGPATLTVFFQDAVTMKSVQDSVQIIVYNITSAPVVAPSTIVAGPDGSQLQIPIQSLITVDTGSANVAVPLTVNFTFFDPDDTSTSAVIDPNGPLPNDNAPVARGGRSGAPDMWFATGTPGAVLTPDGQSLNISTTVTTNGGKPNTVLAQFQPSNIAGDNYLFTVKIYDPQTNQIVSQGSTGVVPVRRTFTFSDLYQTTNGPQISAAFFEPVVDPLFSGDGYTDFTFGSPVVTPNSPQFLQMLLEPTEDEIPDANDLVNYASDDPTVKSAAQASITRKAQHWYDRVSYASTDATLSPNALAVIRTLAGLAVGPGITIPTDRPVLLAANQLSEKEDGDPTTGKTAFYPDGITIQGGQDGSATFNPDGDWPPPVGGILELPSSSDTASAKMMLVFNGATPATIEYAVLHILGHAVRHTPYGPSDHETGGNAFTMMFTPPVTLSGIGLIPLMYTDLELLHIRGWQ